MPLAPPARRPRVLWIWHAAVVAEYRKPIAALAATGAWDMHLLVPEAWPERAGEMVALEPGPPAGYAIHPRPVLFSHHYYVYLIPGLLRALGRLRPDILHVYEEPHSLLAFLILLLRPALERAWGRPLPVLLYAAQNVVKRYPPPFRWFEAVSFRRADMILPCGALVAATLRAKGYRGPLRTVPLPADPAVFRRDPAAAASLRVALGIPAAAPIVGYAGKLVEEKGVATLLTAFLDLPDGDGPTPHLLLAGGGPLRGALAGQAAAAGAGGRVHFLGALGHDDLRAALSAGDIWVVPSESRANWREQFGRAAVEAMAAGNAVVVTDSGELPRVVDGAGRIVPEGDAPALRTALAAWIADPEARAAAAAAGRARVLACYTPEQAAARYAAAYRAVRAARHTRRAPRAGKCAARVKV